MASTRDKRSTAGNRLSKVLNEEVEADDFYATTYGGFNEIENDDDYKSEEEGDDLVDSDFSIEENDEVISDQEDESGKKKRTGVTTKAYKDPKGVKTTGKAEKRKSEQSKAAKSDKKDSSKKVKVESREGLERVDEDGSDLDDEGLSEEETDPEEGDEGSIVEGEEDSVVDVPSLTDDSQIDGEDSDNDSKAKESADSLNGKQESENKSAEV